MTGRILSGYRHELVIHARTTPLGHALAIVAGAAAAAVVVFGWGL